MIGKVLGNRYEIIKKIGGGGMALVFKAKCRLLNRYVAVKVLRPEFTSDEEFIDKFKRESQSAASLSHSNIVNIYDVGEEDNIYYIVMEYVEGITLKKMIKENNQLSSKEVIDISIQIAEALNHAHNNHIVHRDIKPHNIMVSADGRVKVTDFGIAKAATTSTVTNTSNVIGSVHYFSPEQARGGYIDEKSDIYSLGIVMYEMITGSVPFKGDSPISVALKHIQEDVVLPCHIDNSIPKNIERVIKKAVQKDQSLRYKNAEEILKDLRKIEQSDNKEVIELKDYEDSPTRVIPAVNDDMLSRSEKNNKRNNNKRNEKKSNSKKIIMITAILLAFILTSGLALGYLFVKDYLWVEEVDVPNIVGLNENKAKDKIEALGLQLIIDSYKYNDEYKEGHIITQSQSPGNKVKVETPINVIISKGSKLVSVPDITNQYSNEAEILLSKSGLEEGNVTSEFSDYPIGIVISQNPSPDDMVKEGTEVSYVISNGPETKYLIMPKLVNKSLEAAKKEIVSKGFVIGKVNYKHNNDIPKEIVVWQSYPPGTEVEENTVINLTVSDGPQKNDKKLDGEKEIIQDNNNKQNNNSSINDENRKEIKEKQLLIRLPKNKDKVEVKIYKIQASQKQLIYNKTHNTDEESIYVPVSGDGIVKFTIYFDGIFKDEAEYEF